MAAPALRQYQLDLVDGVRDVAIQGARIIVLQLSTGAGKTSCAAYIIKKACEKGKRTAVFIHRRRLVQQFADRLNEFEVSNGIIMRGVRPYASALVQVASRDTIASRCFTHEWTGLPAADLVILDEFRHACDPESSHRQILNQYPNATIIGLDATPVGPDGRGMGPWAQAIVCGPPVSVLIRDGYLCPVKCYAPDRKKSRGGKYKRGIAGDLVESWKAYAEGLPTVLFTSRVEHSKNVVAEFAKEGIKFVHVDADTPDDVRDKIFEEELPSGRIQGVSNVGIVKEGVDVPCLGCVQFYMDPTGRVGFLQGCGRIMRPFTGKHHGVLIDHAGAVFRHGFPDEDTQWTLEGNVDQEFKRKHKAGETEKALYCRHCERLYHGTLACPECGALPAKPPRSIFAPPPVESSNEILTEAERDGSNPAFSRESKVEHWLRCLAVAANRNGSFAMASMIYKQKYHEFPEQDFPCVTGDYKRKVADVYPRFVRRKRQRA